MRICQMEIHPWRRPQTSRIVASWNHSTTTAMATMYLPAVPLRVAMSLMILWHSNKSWWPNFWSNKQRSRRDLQTSSKNKNNSCLSNWLNLQLNRHQRVAPSHPSVAVWTKVLIVQPKPWAFLIRVDCLLWCAVISRAGWWLPIAFRASSRPSAILRRASKNWIKGIWRFYRVTWNFTGDYCSNSTAQSTTFTTFSSAGTCTSGCWWLLATEKNEVWWWSLVCRCACELEAAPSPQPLSSVKSVNWTNKTATEAVADRVPPQQSIHVPHRPVWPHQLRPIANVLVRRQYPLLILIQALLNPMVNIIPSYFYFSIELLKISCVCVTGSFLSRNSSNKQVATGKSRKQPWRCWSTDLLFLVLFGENSQKNEQRRSKNSVRAV